MDEREQYIKIPEYKIIENYEPPSGSRAMTGVKILGRNFFADPYIKPRDL